MTDRPDDIQRQIDQINSMRSVIGEVAAAAAIAALHVKQPGQEF